MKQQLNRVQLGRNDSDALYRSVPLTQSTLLTHYNTCTGSACKANTSSAFAVFLSLRQIPFHSIRFVGPWPQ